MMTLPYGDGILAPATPDATNRLRPTLEMRAAAPVAGGPANGMRPRLASDDPDARPRPQPGPAPSPWTSPHGLTSLVLGLGAAAAVLVGLAMLSVAAAWSTTMPWLAHLALLVAGFYAAAVGTACIAAAQPRTVL